jgi:hypothetical protein
MPNCIDLTHVPLKKLIGHFLLGGLGRPGRCIGAVVFAPSTVTHAIISRGDKMATLAICFLAFVFFESSVTYFSFLIGRNHINRAWAILPLSQPSLHFTSHIESTPAFLY